MILHIEPFHLNDLSDVGFKNLCKYITRKGIIAKEILPSFEEKDFRKKTIQSCQGRLLLNIGQLLEFVDNRVPEGAYNLKRNVQRTKWRFDHEESELNSSEPTELITVLWNIAKIYFEKDREV